MTDAHQYLHNKKVALYGDPDVLLGLMQFLLEMGAKPYHVVCSRANKKFTKAAQALLDSSFYGRDCQVWTNHDLWHLRSLLMNDPVDFMLGDSHGKFPARDAGIPLVRCGFPILDRVNSHRYATIGYQGVINLVTWTANTVIEEMDRHSDDASFEMMR